MFATSLLDLRQQEWQRGLHSNIIENEELTTAAYCGNV